MSTSTTYGGMTLDQVRQAYGGAPELAALIEALADAEAQRNTAQARVAELDEKARQSAAGSAKLRQALTALIKNFEAVRAGLQVAEQERDTLRAALQGLLQVAWHDDDCSRVSGYGNGACDCGFDEAEAEATRVLGEARK